MGKHPVCIACGQPTGARHGLNRLTDGRPCPTCVDRLLDTLPPLLPAPAEELSFEDWGEDEEEDDNYRSGA